MSRFLLNLGVGVVVAFANLFAVSAATAAAGLNEKCQLNNKIKCGSGLICSAKKSDGLPIPGSGGVGVCYSTKPALGEPCLPDQAKCGKGQHCIPYSRNAWGTCRVKQ